MTEKYYFTVGLEIHAELKTQTKMFCSCKNDPDEERPNVNICPVCMAHPGALPVLNKKAIENAIKIGLAVGGKIADFTEFDRKNYFYPDIPKGYQISQYKYPIVSGGHLADFNIARVHLEEDTANSKHDRGNFSLIDFNRAGVPLMELVTEATTFENSESAVLGAVKFAKEFQLMLWYLGVSQANMEKGEMRVEANISISANPRKLGVKVEIKNLNSFRSVERAIKYEFGRMVELLASGKELEIIQETRGWDEDKQKTFSQRKKESSEDYRYFPEPDLPKLKLGEAFNLERMKKELSGKLPENIRERGRREYNLKGEDLEIFVNNPEWVGWLETVASMLKNRSAIQIAWNFMKSDFLGMQKNNINIKLPSPKNFSELVNMFTENKISSRAAKDILAIIAINDQSPMKIAKEKDLLQKNNESALKEIAQKIIESNPKTVADYKGGKENALMSLIGQIMKETKGSANPAITRQILTSLLK